MITKTRSTGKPRERSIGGVLFPRVRRRVLARLFSDPGRRFYAGEIANLIGESLPAVRKELAILSDVAILNSEKTGHHQYYWANTSSMIYPELRGIINKTFGAASTIASALSAEGKKIRVAFLYGSVATGEDTARSDIDLAVIGGITFRELSKALGTAENELGRPLNPTVYSEAEFHDKLKSQNHFVHALVGSPKVFIIGNDDELRELAR